MKPTFKQVMKAGVFAGLISVALNNTWSIVAPFISGHPRPTDIHAGVVSMASFLPIMIGALVYFLIQKYTNKGAIIWAIVSILIFVLTAGGPFQAQLPDGTTAPEGFALFTFPMHIFSAFAAWWGIPKFSQTKA